MIHKAPHHDGAAWRIGLTKRECIRQHTTLSVEDVFQEIALGVRVTVILLEARASSASLAIQERPNSFCRKDGGIPFLTTLAATDLKMPHVVSLHRLLFCLTGDPPCKAFELFLLVAGGSAAPALSVNREPLWTHF